MEWFLVILLTLFSSRAFALKGSCSSVRMDSPGGSMEFVPVRDQGAIPNCYAQTAAALIDAWRFSHGDQQKDFHTSALLLSVDYNLRYKDEPLSQGGFTCRAWSLSQRFGVCRHDALNARVGEVQGLSAQSIKKLPAETRLSDFFRSIINQKVYLNTLTNGTSLSGTIRDRAKESLEMGKFYSTRYGWLKFPEYNYPSSSSPGFAPKSRRAMAQEYQAEHRKQVVKNACEQLQANGLPLNLSDLVAIDEALKDTDPKEVARELRKIICSKSNIIYPKTSECHEDFDEERSYLQAIDDRLSKPRPQPIAVSYCTGFIGSSDPTVHKKTCEGGHSSLVIGRKRNEKTGKCQWLVRNSWGTSCEAYKNLLDCENGSFWIDSDVFDKNVYAIQYLE